MNYFNCGIPSSFCLKSVCLSDSEGFWVVLSLGTETANSKSFKSFWYQHRKMAPIYPGTDDLWRAENLPFVFNSIITSFHSNEANSAIVTQLMTSLPLMWHGKIFYGKCCLVVVWQSSTYNIVKVIKLFKTLPQKILGDFVW